MKFTLRLLVFLYLCFLIPKGFRSVTQGFRLEKLRLECVNHPEWDISSPSSQEMSEILAVLQQPFYYLNRGAQSYVFSSQDDRYVLKFFRPEPREKKFGKPGHWHLPYKTKPTPQYHGFTSAKMAYELAREYTGVVFVHLNITQGQFPVVHLYDRLHRRYDLPLDDFRFTLQKKAVPLARALKLASEKTEAHEVQSIIDGLFALLEERTQAKLINTDKALFRNFGVCEGKVIEMDFGNYLFDPIESGEKSLPLCQIEQYAPKVQIWLTEHKPELLCYYENKLKELRERL